jgi:hypothetical protein
MRPSRPQIESTIVFFTTRIGGDFDSVGVAFQTVWFGRP